MGSADTGTGKVARESGGAWRKGFLVAAGLALAAAAQAAPVTYLIDPDHTYPSFEADHMGLSVWRGKFNQTRGKVVLDKAAGQGTLEVVITTESIDFGNEAMNRVARGSEMFDTDKYPQATYTGQLTGFGGGRPTRAEGTLTLRGVTRPLALEILSFRCVPHPFLRVREVCGADVQGSFQRDDFGIDAGKLFGFDMKVLLRIQVEAIEAERGAAPP